MFKVDCQHPGIKRFFFIKYNGDYVQVQTICTFQKNKLKEIYLLHKTEASKLQNTFNSSATFSLL